jgi:NAD(P)-dependent dehydrogenase (short-subunit alcohol dehydrogenase family)
MTADLTGKVVLVLGANTGIGLEATKHFVKMGATRVILGARNSEKSERALEGAP